MPKKFIPKTRMGLPVCPACDGVIINLNNQTCVVRRDIKTCICHVTHRWPHPFRVDPDPEHGPKRG